MELKEDARETRISKYKVRVRNKLASRIIKAGKGNFKDIMHTLNGEILVKRHIEKGILKGVHSVTVDNFAALLPDIKKDVDDVTGWRDFVEGLWTEGIDILADVDDPDALEYD